MDIVSDPVRDATRDAGGARGVIESALAASESRAPATLALVVETDGSTYVRAGSAALFDAGGRHTGWLSGGCLEPEVEAHARRAATKGTIGWLELDTRDDAHLFAGAALGCRGRLRIALLPLRAMPGFDALARRWLAGDGAMRWSLERNGAVDCAVASAREAWRLPGDAPPWPAGASPHAYALELRAPPSVLVLGAGPEAPVLLPLLRALGFMTTAVEQRLRWRDYAALADRAIVAAPAPGLLAAMSRPIDAALVMHHAFELDRDALEALASTSIPYLGLLGPNRRREDLLRVLPAAARAALAPRLRSPIGMKLGGQGPEAIALSIAAQLQSHFHAA